MGSNTLFYARLFYQRYCSLIGIINTLIPSSLFPDQLSARSPVEDFAYQRDKEISRRQVMFAC